MSEENKSALVPRLRFPEFREAGEWEEVALGDVCERIMDGTHFSPASKSGPFLYLTSKNVRPGALVLDDVSYISEEEHSSIFSRCPVKKNDLLLTKDGASTGNCTLNPLGFEFSLLSSVAVIRGNSEKILQEFLAQDFQAPHIQDQIADAISGQAITRITLEKIKLFKVWLTSSHEQQKIADCLSSLDELITAETQKLAALKTHKKGLMQQLFPREGETVPRLRFPEFREAGEWSKVPAGKLFSNRIERGRAGLPIYSVTMTDGLVPRASLDRKIDDIAETGANKTARAGDLAYNMMRMWQGALGVVPEDCMVSPAYIVLEPQGVNPFFFYFLLKLPQSLRVLTAHSRGLTEDRLRLYYDDFAKVALQCPSRPEQDRIADCLMSVDDLIAAQSQKVYALKTHKKGLMQQLFPSVGGVAGEA